VAVFTIKGFSKTVIWTIIWAYTETRKRNFVRYVCTPNRTGKIEPLMKGLSIEISPEYPFDLPPCYLQFFLDTPPGSPYTSGHITEFRHLLDSFKVREVSYYWAGIFQILIRALMFRRDYPSSVAGLLRRVDRINKIFLPFWPPAPLQARRPEWQKTSSLFEGKRSLIAPITQ